MSYAPANPLLIPGRHSIDTMTDSWIPSTSTPGSGTWPSANLAIYVPLRIPRRVVVVKLWYAGGTTGTGNADMGLYDAAGVAVISATNAAKSAAADEVTFDVTDTVVGPGLYYIALSADSATDTYYRHSVSAPTAVAFGVLTEASAYPLPATATWALDHTLTFIPIIGVLLESTVA